MQENDNHPHLSKWQEEQLKTVYSCSAKNGMAVTHFNKEDHTDYEPDKWNKRQRVADNNNCYCYALDLTKTPSDWLVPGWIAYANEDIPLEDVQKRRSLKSEFNKYARYLTEMSVLDGLIFVGKKPETRPGYRLVALALETEDTKDFHWYRLDKEGTWSHKPGTSEVRRVDEQGHIIKNPETADRGDYDVFVGYFLVPKEGVKWKNDRKMRLASKISEGTRKIRRVFGVDF